MFISRRLLHSFPNRANQMLVESMLRVNHAGELAADRIYAGQMAVLGRGSSAKSVSHRESPVAQTVQRMWNEEKEHLDTLERLCAKHQVPITIFAPLCSAAGYALGAATALMGEKSAMACTVAVEELIAQHYNEQIRQLLEESESGQDNKELLKVISRLRDEELEHHDTGIEYKGLEAPFYDSLKWVIQSGCKVGIWLTKRI